MSNVFINFHYYLELSFKYYAVVIYYHTILDFSGDDINKLTAYLQILKHITLYVYNMF